MLIDFTALELGWRPNQFLMLPADFPARAKPHATSPIFPATTEALIAAVKQVALAEPRTVLLAEDEAAFQAEFVQRSRTFRFPDRITVAALPARNGSALAAYSRARYGIRDFGVNRARIERWVAALPSAIRR